MKIKFLIVLISLLFASSLAFPWKKKEQPSLYLTPSDPRSDYNYEEKVKSHSVFEVGKRIYFYVYTPEGFSSDYIKYQIVKQDDNAHVGGYTRVRNITRRVKNKHYYLDYFVLNEKGKYILQIFNIDNLHQWITYGEFRVVE